MIKEDKWVLIAKELSKGVNHWKDLSPFTWETKPPSKFCIYKKKYNPLKSDLRHIDADVCLGFYNFSNEPLKITIQTVDTASIRKELFTILPHRCSDGATTYWFSKNRSTTYRLVEVSHEDFYILYIWF